MRIIKNPNPEPEVTMECDVCHCIFAYTKGDIKHKSWHNGVLGPGSAGYQKQSVTCPNCGKVHVISEKYGSGTPRINYNTVELR